MFQGVCGFVLYSHSPSENDGDDVTLRSFGTSRSSSAPQTHEKSRVPGWNHHRLWNSTIPYHTGVYVLSREGKVTDLRDNLALCVERPKATSFRVIGHYFPGGLPAKVTAFRVKGHRFPGGSSSKVTSPRVKRFPRVLPLKIRSIPRSIGHFSPGYRTRVVA